MSWLRSVTDWRISRRKAISFKVACLIRFLAVVGALGIGALVILSLGHNPFAVYWEMVDATFGARIGFNATIRSFIPLLGAALAVGMAFKMRFWNIGAEGQILAGGIAATYFALFHFEAMPRPILLTVMAVAAIIAGGIWGFIPAFFRARWGTNETLFTLMLNYVALRIIMHLQSGPWQSPLFAGFPMMDMFDPVARLPQVFGIHIGWIMVLVVVVLVHFYLAKSKQGYQLSVVGESENTARYAGMNVRRIVMRTMFISGGIAGLSGFWIVSGAHFNLSENTAGGVGFTAIIVAWLAGLKPLYMIPIALLIAVLERGSGRIQTAFGIPATIAEVLIGIILFAMLASEFFIQYRVINAKTAVATNTEAVTDIESTTGGDA